MTPEEKDQHKRKLLFQQCESKEDLSAWLKIFLGVDLPDCTVALTDTDPSNSNPMDLLWEIYSKTSQNNDPKFHSVLMYASRGGFKTVLTAIVETLTIMHFERDVVHGAAILEQSTKAREYIREYFSLPYLREFSIGDNKREFIVSKFVHLDDGTIISPGEYRALNKAEQNQYIERTNKLNIVVATVKSMNGQHAPLFVADEFDLIDNNKVIQEGKRIPQPPRGGGTPLTFYTSTRKSGSGPIQKEIDNHAKTGVQIRHWNAIDLTEPCPRSRSKAGKGKIDLFIDKDKLKTINREEFDKLLDTDKIKYTPAQGYPGCEKCPLFVGCQGRLATSQKSKSKWLKTIDNTINEFITSDLDTLKSQILCWKPSQEGLIYPYYDPTAHMVSATEMVQMITGEETEREYTKQDLIAMCKKNKVRFYSGVDHGYTHDFSVVTGALIGYKLLVFDVISISGLELAERISLCKTRIQHLDPVLYPDPAYPADNVSFQRAGFNIKKFEKDVLKGIECVRYKLRPGPNQAPEIFFLQDDEGCDWLSKCMKQYHWKRDANGNLTEIPDKTDDDALDALRYLCQNLFSGSALRVRRAIGVDKEESDVNNWMSKEIKRLATNEVDNLPQGGRSKSGGFRWRI